MEDTIVAVSTPAGRGAIAVVRLSGSAALAIADRMAVVENSGKKPSRFPSQTLRLISLADSEGIIDTVMAAVMRAPRSYTGFDLVEFHCHGSPVITRRIMEAAVEFGARPAGRGEFTRQAILNDKMDLTRAEALVDLINADSRNAARAALSGLEGEIAGALEGWWGSLADMLARIEARLDFPEEEIEPLDGAKIKEDIDRLRSEAEATEAAGRRAKAAVASFHVAIAGPPNSGKSTLLNALLGFERAIVTELPGTTRDTVEDEIEIDDALVRLVDTAGLRGVGGDKVEEIGIRRSIQAMETADLVLFLVDGGRGEMPGGSFERIDRSNRILTVNKIDLTGNELPDRYAEEFPDEEPIGVSALKGTNVDRLLKLIKGRLGRDRGLPEGGPIITRTRQLDLLKRIISGLDRAAGSIERNEPAEITAYELRETAGYLEEMMGRGITEEVLDRIFESFCIGK